MKNDGSNKAPDWFLKCIEPAQASAAPEQEPACYQFQDREGKWHCFVDERHQQATIDSGDWPIRKLYEHADPSEVAQLRANRDAATQRADAAERKLSEAVGLLTKALAGCDEATETFEDESNGPGQWRCHACWSDCSAGWHHGKIVSGSHTQISHEPDCWAESARALLSASAEPDKCTTCQGRGEIYSGQDQHFDYFDFQPPEPIMDVCPECGGEPAKGGEVKS